MIDTLEKRMSLLSFGRAGFTLPIADGSVAIGDRQHFLGLFASDSSAAKIFPGTVLITRFQFGGVTIQRASS